MMGRLSNKVAVITGGTTGIGAATARLFLEEGATVVATGSSVRSVEAAREALPGVELVAVDQADPPAVKALLDDVAGRYGRIDILFVNAGIVDFKPLALADEAHFDRQFGVNVRGAFFTAKHGAPHIPDGGTILFTASTTAHAGTAGASVYAATKAAVRSFARSLGAELAPRNVRVNVLSPGPIDTPIFGKAGFSEEQQQGLKQQVIGMVPLKRFGRPEEMAQAALFLVADATFVTGGELIAGGGMIDI